MDYILIYKIWQPYVDRRIKNKIHRYYQYLEADITVQPIRTNDLNRHKLPTSFMHCKYFKVDGKKGFGEMNEHLSKTMEVTGLFLRGPFHESLEIPSHMTNSLPRDPTWK